MKSRRLGSLLVTRQLGLLAAVLAVVGFSQWFTLRSVLYETTAHTLKGTQMVLFPLVQHALKNPTSRRYQILAHLMRRVKAPDTELVIANSKGTVLAASQTAPLARPPSTGGGYVLWRGRVVIESVIGRPSHPLGYLWMMSSIRSSHQILLQDVEILAAVSAVVLILFALLGTWSVKAAIAPLKPVVASTLRIARGDWGYTAPVPPQPVELRELSQAVNRMSLAIRAAFEKERAVSEQMRRFVADASHELRTPLTAITGFLALLEGGELDPEETQRGLRAMRREGQRMTRLVHQLLTLSRLDTAPELQVHPAPLDLSDWLEESRPALEAVLGNHPLRVVGPSPPEPVYTDPDALSEILFNLLENAARFAPAGSPVSLHYGTDSEGIFIRVSDQGPGLSDDALARAFDRFYRSDPARTGGHSGLGLSIVQALVQAQGGTVEVTNADPPGHGAVFTLHFRSALRS